MAEQWTGVGGVVVQSAENHVAPCVCDFIMPHELGTSLPRLISSASPALLSVVAPPDLHKLQAVSRQSSTGKP
jgi:hypothetical protein